MSDPVIKGVKRSSSRPTSRNAPPAKNSSLGAKGAKPIAKRSGAEKAPARKAANKSAATPASKPAQASKLKPPAKATTKSSVAAKGKAAVKAAVKAPVKTISRAAAKPAAGPTPKPAKQAAAAKARPEAKPAAAAPRPTPATPRQPTQDEAAALKAFERAHREFARGRFLDARNLFRQLIEQHAGVSEVTARARTYLTVAEARLRSEASLPRSAEDLYDRGVIELNRGDYVAAQEMFERALKREPAGAHIHYGLAATRARLGAVELALRALERALELQPSLRIRAQHDADLAALRTDPEYERLIFAARA